MVRPATGSCLDFFMPASSASHCALTSPLSYSGPRAFSADRSGYATPIRIVVGVTPRAEPEATGAPAPPPPVEPPAPGLVPAPVLPPVPPPAAGPAAAPPEVTAPLPV